MTNTNTVQMKHTANDRNGCAFIVPSCDGAEMLPSTLRIMRQSDPDSPIPPS